MGKKGKQKKRGFLKRQKEKLARKKKQRKQSLKTIKSPMKYLKSLPAEKIKEFLEDSPYLQEEQEFADFTFNEELVVKFTTSTLEKYQERFEESRTKTTSVKRQVYEDFCVEAVGKMVGKAFLVSLKRRLRMAAQRLKDEGNKDQMMRAIISEATLNIPQIPLEAHPIVVGMYEDARLKIMGDDFKLEGYEDVSYWKERVRVEREEERTARFKTSEPDKISDQVKSLPTAQAAEVDGKPAFSLNREREDEPFCTIVVEGETLTLRGNSVPDKEAGMELLMAEFGETLSEIVESDDEDSETAEVTSDDKKQVKPEEEEKNDNTKD